MSAIALKAGQAATEFWLGDPSWTWTYIRNWEADQRTDWKRKDMEQWQLGVYIKLAVVSSFSKDAEYPDRQMFYEPTLEEKIAESKLEMEKLFGSLVIGE